MKSIAVILTCFNRKAMTLECLDVLYQTTVPLNFTMDVYLVDDGSTDGTGEAVINQFPLVNVIDGTGSLYWNQGMRLAWKTAVKNKIYDFFLWLNDDTLLDVDAITELVSSYDDVIKKKQKLPIVCGACRKEHGKDEFSYGGRINHEEIIPNGELQACKEINGNIVLVSKAIYDVIGMLSNSYTHGMGDVDYGLRALERGFVCFTSRKYIATCPPNESVEGWSDSSNSLRERLKILYSPTGLNIKEYIIFRKRFWGWRWIIYALKVYVKALFPSLYKVMFK